MNQYNSDYFERGQELGISGYTDYKWLPELTLPMAHTMVVYLGIKPTDKILDFGCAKGFVTKAFRMLHYDARGYDISEYALSQAPDDIRPFVSNIWPKEQFDWIIAKDVLEHISHAEIDDLLYKFNKISKKVFAIIPAGDGKSYNVPSYNDDVTHRIKETKEWWYRTFEINEFKNINITYRVPNLKENYAQFENGNLFITAERSANQK